MGAERQAYTGDCGTGGGVEQVLRSSKFDAKRLLFIARVKCNLGPGIFPSNKVSAIVITHTCEEENCCQDFSAHKHNWWSTYRMTSICGNPLE